MTTEWINFNDNIPEGNKLFLIKTRQFISVGYITGTRIIWEQHFNTTCITDSSSVFGINAQSVYRYVKDDDPELTTLRLINL